MIEGQPEDGWYGIRITRRGGNGGAGNFKIVETIRKRYGDGSSIIIIDHTGEMRLLAANISVKDPGGRLRSNAEVDSVQSWGPKRVKFIVTNNENTLQV